jgi:hypothetical protein
VGRPRPGPQYFIDTHDLTEGSFPVEEVTQDQFLAVYNSFDDALQAVFDAHAKVGLPYDSITRVQRVSGMDLR